jgi:hypothetical protein
MAVKANNSKVGYAAVARVAIHMMYLDVLPWHVADATSVIISV